MPLIELGRSLLADIGGRRCRFAEENKDGDDYCDMSPSLPTVCQVSHEIYQLGAVRA